MTRPRMDLEQATVHRLHKSSRLLLSLMLLLLLLLLLLFEYLLLLLMELPIELVVRFFPGLERLLLLCIEDLGVAFEDDFIAVADLFLEAGVIIVDDFEPVANDDDEDDVTLLLSATPPLPLCAYEAELSPVNIRSNANSTLKELERNVCDKSLSDTFMPIPVTKSRRVDSLLRKEELLERVIFLLCVHGGSGEPSL